MSQLINLVGQKFGSLTVLERAPGKNKQVYWTCQCDCGTIKDVKSQHLREGKIKTCGRCNANTIIGQQFKNWLVLEATDQKSGTLILYKCKCIHCGHIGYKTSPDLKTYAFDRCENCRATWLIGQRFGKLVVEERAGATQYRHTVWKCRCDCGNITYGTYTHLASGDKISCGCVVSKGEAKINQILTENNIEFIQQKTFDSCRFSDSDCLAKFDFYLPAYNILIEYDGAQHYEECGYGWFTVERLQEIKKRDEYKNQWCQENNIPLIRIPYTEYENLSIEMIQKFIEEVKQ